jgi:hypothetical protein
MVSLLKEKDKVIGMIVRIRAIYDKDMRVAKWLVMFSDRRLKVGKVNINNDLIIEEEGHSFYYVDARFVAWDESHDYVYIETR